MQERIIVLVYDLDLNLNCPIFPQVMRIMDNVQPTRQTVMFSATFPRQVEALAKKILTKPIEITVSIVYSLDSLILNTNHL